MVFCFDLIHVRKIQELIFEPKPTPSDPRLQNSTTEVTLKYLLIWIFMILFQVYISQTFVCEKYQPVRIH